MTTILAIIGAITGVAGLSIQFVSYLSSRPKINFGQSSKPNQSLYIVPSDGTFGILNGYPVMSGVSYAAIYIQMTINNKSPQPVTILDPWITIQGERVKTYKGNNVTLDSPTITSNDGKITTTNEFPKQAALKFPLRIEGFDSISGSTTFIVFNDKQIFKTTKVSLPTTNKIFTEKFYLDEFSEWRCKAMSHLKS